MSRMSRAMLAGTGDLACLAGSCEVTSGACTHKPPRGPFTPRIAWQWTTSHVHPEDVDVLTTPVVVPRSGAQADAAAPPAVAFNTILPHRVAALPGAAGLVSDPPSSARHGWLGAAGRPGRGLPGAPAC